jgi:hypothetical protein
VAPVPSIATGWRGAPEVARRCLCRSASLAVFVDFGAPSGPRAPWGEALFDAQSTPAPAGPIASMSREDILALDISKLTPAQRQAVANRMSALGM